MVRLIARAGIAFVVVYFAWHVGPVYVAHRQFKAEVAETTRAGGLGPAQELVTAVQSVAERVGVRLDADVYLSRAHVHATAQVVSDGHVSVDIPRQHPGSGHRHPTVERRGPLRLALRTTADGVLIPVRVIARSPRTRISDVRVGRVVVRISAAPVDGAANVAPVKLLAKALAVPAGTRDKSVFGRVRALLESPGQG